MSAPGTVATDSIERDAPTSVTTETVAAADADIRLDRWLRRRFPGLTQGAIEKLCRTGQMRVDGKRVAAATRLLPGQSVRVPPIAAGDRPDPASRPRPAIDPEEADAFRRSVLWRDDQVIAIDKPPGLATQGGPGIARHVDGLLDVLAEGGERPRLVHRLDRDTSGVLLLARTAASAARLAALFRGHDVEKTYWAVVVGRPVPPEGRIALSLARVIGPGGERMTVADDGPDAARAETDFRTLDHAGRRLAWLELSPRSGRTHQLRVHCAAIGAPILGDRKYGGHAVVLDGFSDRMHLHARALRLPHPAGGMLEVAAPLPPHMAATFHDLGFTAPPPSPPTGPARRG